MPDHRVSDRLRTYSDRTWRVANQALLRAGIRWHLHGLPFRRPAHEWLGDADSYPESYGISFQHRRPPEVRAAISAESGRVSFPLRSSFHAYEAKRYCTHRGQLS